MIESLSIWIKILKIVLRWFMHYTIITLWVSISHCKAWTSMWYLTMTMQLMWECCTRWWPKPTSFPLSQKTNINILNRKRYSCFSINYFSPCLSSCPKQLPSSLPASWGKSAPNTFKLRILLPSTLTIGYDWKDRLIIIHRARSLFEFSRKVFTGLAYNLEVEFLNKRLHSLYSLIKNSQMAILALDAL